MMRMDKKDRRCWQGVERRWCIGGVTFTEPLKSPQEANDSNVALCSLEGKLLLHIELQMLYRIQITQNMLYY